MAEQLLGPPQSPADLDDDREVPTARVLDALRQLVNLGAASLRDAVIVKEGLGQSFAQRDGARDLVGDERRLKTLSQLNLLGSMRALSIVRHLSGRSGRTSVVQLRLVEGVAAHFGWR